LRLGEGRIPSRDVARMPMNPPTPSPPTPNQPSVNPNAPLPGYGNLSAKAATKAKRAHADI
jgi:hypothetical protein